MSYPTYLTCICLSTLKALCKLRCACLTALTLARCALWSAALLSASFQVSWEIQDTRTFFGRGSLETPPLRNKKAAPLSVWGLIVFDRIPPSVTTVT